MLQDHQSEPSPDYQEFKLRVPIWDLADEAGESDSLNVTSLFELLEVAHPLTSLIDLYDSFYDHATARYNGDPYGRIGRGDLLVFRSDLDEDVFIAIDMFHEATDQMNTVSIEVRSPKCLASAIFKLMQTIRSNAEVASSLLQGDLGLKDGIAFENFPRLVMNHTAEVFQNVQVFKSGELLCSTNSI